MKKFIAILLIILVSNNIIVENNFKLRKTAEIELEQILNDIKEYIEEGIKNIFEYFDKIAENFEKNKIDKKLSKFTKFLKDLKEKLKKYKFDELVRIYEFYIDKLINFLFFLNLDIITDELLNLFDKIREFFSITYFNEEFEGYFLLNIRKEIANMDIREIEKELLYPFFEFLYEIKRFNRKSVIERLIDPLEKYYRYYSEDKFKHKFKNLKRDFYGEMEMILNKIYRTENNLREEIMKKKEELSDIVFDEKLKQEFSEAFEKIQKSINNLDTEKLFKVIKFVMETIIYKITTKNLDPNFNIIKSYIEKLKEYLYKEIYDNIIEFYDNLIQEIKKLTNKINPESMEKKIKKFIKTIQDYFKNIDTVEFIKQVDKIFDENLRYILKFDFQTLIHRFFQYIVKIQQVINNLGFDYLVTFINITIEYINFLYESLPRAYKKYDEEIDGEGFYI